MADRIKDGGPAFPTTPIYNGDDEVVAAGPGMSLRDWFAGHALIGLLAGPTRNFRTLQDDDSPSETDKMQERVFLAFEYADCMIAERSQ